MKSSHYLENFKKQIDDYGLRDAFTPEEREQLIEGLAKARNSKELNKAQKAVEKVLAKKLELKLVKERFEKQLNALLDKNYQIKPKGSGDNINAFRADLRAFVQGRVPLKKIEKEWEMVKKYFEPRREKGI